MIKSMNDAVYINGKICRPPPRNKNFFTNPMNSCHLCYNYIHFLVTVGVYLACLVM